MAIACICGSFGKPADQHEVDCPVRRRAEQESGGSLGAPSIKPPDLTVREDGVVVPGTRGCDCGLGSTKPAYRHARSCPVYRAWVERERPEDGFAVGQAVRLKGHDLRGRVICVDARGPSAVVVLWDKGATEVAEHMAGSLLEPAPRRAVVWVGAFDGAFSETPVGLRPRNLLGVYREHERAVAIADGVKSLTRVELEEGRFDE